MILVSAVLEILPHFHQNVVLVISGNIFPSIEVNSCFGGE